MAIIISFDLFFKEKPSDIMDFLSRNLTKNQTIARVKMRVVVNDINNLRIISDSLGKKPNKILAIPLDIINTIKNTIKNVVALSQPVLIIMFVLPLPLLINIC